MSDDQISWNKAIGIVNRDEAVKRNSTVIATNIRAEGKMTQSIQSVEDRSKRRQGATSNDMIVNCKFYSKSHPRAKRPAYNFCHNTGHFQKQCYSLRRRIPIPLKQWIPRKRQLPFRYNILKHHLTWE